MRHTKLIRIKRPTPFSHTESFLCTTREKNRLTRKKTAYPLIMCTQKRIQQAAWSDAEIRASAAMRTVHSSSKARMQCEARPFRKTKKALGKFSPFFSSQRWRSLNGPPINLRFTASRNCFDASDMPIQGLRGMCGHHFSSESAGSFQCLCALHQWTR